VRLANGVTPERRRFEILYAETRLGLLGYFLRRVDCAPDAADLLSETYLIAWRKIDSIPNDGTARLWLYGVARRVASNHHRHENVAQGLAETLRADLSREAAAMFTESDMPLGEVIYSSLDRLKPSDREIIELSAWEQLTPIEIAIIVGMKPGTVRVRLHRIRIAIRADLIRSGYPRSDPLGRVG
jgi:RNA polymerase sigma factor (sigma-70 family)